MEGLSRDRGDAGASSAAPGGKGRLRNSPPASKILPLDTLLCVPCIQGDSYFHAAFQTSIITTP